jgi:hypothetical protein
MSQHSIFYYTVIEFSSIIFKFFNISCKLSSGPKMHMGKISVDTDILPPAEFIACASFSADAETHLGDYIMNL